MKKPSIKKRKSNINGQTFVDIQELPKRDPKVSFADSVNNLQLKLLSKEIDIGRPKSSTSLPISKEGNFFHSNSNFNGINGIEGKNNNLYKSYSNKNVLLQNTNLDENDKVMKKFWKRHSMRVSHHKNFDENFLSRKKSQNDLAIIKEIVISDKNESTITNNPKHRFKCLEKQDEEKNNTKKKINVIEELRKFDREQQIKFEDYIDKKRYQQNEFFFKNSKIYKILNNENKDEIEDFLLNNNHHYIPKYNEFKYQENFFNKYNSINVEKNVESSRLQNYNNNKTINNNSINKNNGKDNFQKIKEKYFAQSIYTPKIPNTEFKTKYLDKFIQNNNNKSLVKNIFANYVDEKNKNEIINNNIKENNINITNNNNENNININNNNNHSKEINSYPLNHQESEKEINNNQEKNFYIKNNSIIISPKLFYKKTNETDSSKILIDSNNKIKDNIEQSNKSNMNTININKINNKYKLDDDLEETYKSIINAIDDKLYNKKKKNRKIISNDNSNRIISSSAEKIKTTSNGYNYLFNKSYNNSFLNNTKNNRYYKEISEKYDNINGLKMVPYYNRNSITNYFNRNYNNKDYKYIRIVNQIKNNKQPYKARVFPF